MNNAQSRRLLTLLSLIPIIPLGLLSKTYSGVAQEWVHDNSGAILYEIFWSLCLFLFFPSRKAVIHIPLLVFTLTCIIEFMQLWHPPFLEWVRSFPVGKLLLGTTFAWLDLPHYLLGCVLSWLWLRQIYNNLKWSGS